MNRADRHSIISLRRRKIELCASAAIGAIALAVTTAGAQSYNATPTVVAGDIYYSQSSGVTDVQMNTTSAVIRWDVPAGTGTYDFQTSGTATFHYFSDFTVLNVVNTLGTGGPRPIQFNGATVSQVNGSAGGNVWFYSPGGMIVGSTASFNVGSLLLTTAQPSDQGPSFSTTSVSLGSIPAATTSSIVVESGASITANNYVAMVAPRIEQRGTVRAGGEIAYVAAEDADITFPTGSNLFSIDIGSGTDAINGQGQVLVHTGTTGGPGAGANTPNRNIYFLAMPKNSAITTLLGGTVGYDAASGAATNAEGIYLVSGGVILGGQPYQNNDFIALPGQLDERPTNLAITSGATFLQSVTAYATNISTQALTGDISFAKGAALHATLNNTLNIAAGRQLTSGGNFSLYAQGHDSGFNLIGGSVDATVNGTLRVGTALNDPAGLLLSAESIGAPESDPTGGTVSLAIDGGSVVTGLGGIQLNADGTGGEGFFIEGGDGFGGTATLSLKGSLNTGGAVLVTARGVGGNSDRRYGGAGVGGTASLTSSPTSSVPTPTLGATAITVAANGTGGSGTCVSCSPVGTTGGAGTGGTATITLVDTNVLSQNLLAEAAGTGGSAGTDSFPAVGGTGGNGSGGRASISVTRGTTATQSISALADGSGGNGGDSEDGELGEPSGTGGKGGSGTGGQAAQGKGASVSLAGATLTAGEGDTFIIVTSNGTGGSGGFSESGVGGDGGNGIGGDAAFNQSLASSVFADVALQSIGSGGSGGGTGGSGYSHGGDAIGGATSFTASGGGTFTGTLSLYANGENGFGGGPDIVGYHGVTQGGTSTTVISDTSVTLSDFFSTTRGSSVFEGNDQFQDAGATGGATSLTVSGNGTLTVDSLDIGTSGIELGGRQGATGGTAGAVTVRTNGNGSIVASESTITAEGQGGFSNQGAGGNGIGGAVLIEANGGTISLGSATVNAGGGAGQGTTGVSIGTGGSITINALNGGLVASGSTLDLDARGTTFSDGNRAVGGAIALTANGGRFTIGELTARSSGHLQNVGTSTGGSISIVATGAASPGGSSFGPTTLEALGTNSAGLITIRNDTSGGTTPLSFFSLTATATGSTTNPAIRISSSESPITAATATITTDTGVAFSATNGGTFSVAGDLDVAADLFVSVNGGGSSTPSIQANNLLFTTGSFDGLGTTILKATSDLEIDASSQVTAQTLTAGNSIFVHSPGNVTIGTATVTDPAQPGEAGLDESISRLEIDAGYEDEAPGLPANLTINSLASAGGLALLQATGDINVAAGAIIRSDNELQLNAGDDIVIGAGANLTGAANPFGGAGGFARLIAGDGTGAAGVHALINGGTIGAAGSLLTVRGDAIQSSGTLAGRSVTASLTSGTITGDDGGALLTNCAAGNICLGTIAATGPVSIGTSGRIPTTTRIAGDVSATTLNVRADSGLFLGGTVPATMSVSGAASFNAGTGPLNGLGTVAINAATITLTSANDIVASGVSFRATGNVVLNVPRDLIVADLIAGGQILPSPASYRQVNIAGQISAGTGGLDLSASGPISLNTVVLGNTAPLKLTATGDLTLSQVTAPGSITLSSGGGISAGNVTGGADVSVVAARGISFGTLSGASVSLIANGGAIDGAALSIAGKATLQAAGAVRLSGAVATGTGAAPAQNAAVQGVNDSLGNGGDLAISATGDITLNTAVAGGRALLTSGGAVSINALRSGGDLSISAPGNIVFGSMAGNAVTLTSNGGAISGQSLAASYTTTLAAAGQLQVSGLSSADTVTASGRSITLAAPNALTLASLTSGGSVLVDANSLTVNGQIQGTTIDLGSQSISVGSNARIGTAGTTSSVTFRNNGSGRSFIGTTGSGYTLASAALARVQANSINLILPQAAGSSATQPDVVIGDVTLHGSAGTAAGTLANLTSAGSFTVQTAGRVQVTGKLALTDLASGNSATIAAGQGIDVVAPAGQILLTDSAGNPQGTLTLTAPRVLVASASAISDLATLTSYDQREARLARNDGSTSDQGYIVGGHLVFRVANALDIQNSGASSAPADRRGVTAGAGGLDVFATSSTLPEIIINGRQSASAGGFTGGFELKPLVRTANASGTVDAASVLSVNGCTPTRCSLTSPVDIAFTYLPMVPPPQDVEDLLETEGETAQTIPVLTQPLIALPTTTPYSFAPVVDEPVTGVGAETVGFGTGPEAGNGPATGNLGTGNVGTGNDGPSGGRGTQSGNVGTGDDNGNLGTGPENGNVGTGPAGGNGPAGATPSTGPQSGNVGTGNENGNVGTGPEGAAPPAGARTGGDGRGQQNDAVGDGPQNDNVGSGPSDDRSRTPGR